MRGLALISVADKTGIVELATELARQGYEIVSTGGTANALKQAKVPVTPVESLTRTPEMLDGRVKTLHPAVHGGILARRDLEAHMQAIWNAGIRTIDIVVVNLYPFRETVARPDVSFEDAIEQIDIGGPSMVRSAAKNHRDVVVVVDPADYVRVGEDLRANKMTAERRKGLAQKAFALTASYDAAIAAWLAGKPLPGEQVGPAALTPTAVQRPAPRPTRELDAGPLAEGVLRIDLDSPETLRYGENPHQAAWRYRDVASVLVDAVDFHVHQGKSLSYNNLIDADAAWALVCDLPTDRPGAVVVKHTNPCGVGSVTTSVAGAVLRAFDGDPVSAFGGIVAVNRIFDVTAARAIADKFLEVVLAPAFEDEALEILAAKPNLRVVEMGPLDPTRIRRIVRPTVFGVLMQEPDLSPMALAGAQVVTKVAPTESEWRALDLLWRVAKHVKSNAIVVGDENGTVGVGAGQMSRVDSAVIAIGKARKGLKSIAAASDAFFPFADGIEQLIKAGVRAVVQPGGSKRDAEVIAAADAAKIAMVMTGQRHFRH